MSWSNINSAITSTTHIRFSLKLISYFSHHKSLKILISAYIINLQKLEAVESERNRQTAISWFLEDEMNTKKRNNSALNAQRIHPHRVAISSRFWFNFTINFFCYFSCCFTSNCNIQSNLNVWKTKSASLIFSVFHGEF